MQQSLLIPPLNERFAHQRLTLTLQIALNELDYLPMTPHVTLVDNSVDLCIPIGHFWGVER
jgi:hypothetical protein